MIRPITFICFLLACGSGLYLYQSKHRVQMLDHEIEQTVHATDTLREQTRVLHAEWTLLNDPQRLQALADQFLNLKTVAPGQFTNMAELDSRLPPVIAPDPIPPAASPVPIAQAPDTTRPEEPQPPPLIAAVPVQPKPASLAATSPPPRIPEHKTALPPRPQIAEVASTRLAPAAPRPVAMAELPRPAPPRIMHAAIAASQPMAPFAGSALGMAHSGALPPPRPMPVSASQWVSNGGGGG